jgi:ABC-2 type transport system permease protein
MGQILSLSLRQLTGRRRFILIALVAAIPAGLTVIMVTFGEQVNRPDFAQVMLDGMIVAAVLPIVTMVLATAAFGHEVEDKTLSYLTLKPLSRWRIVLPKSLAVVIVGGPLLVASGVAATLIGLDRDVRAALAVGVALLIGVSAYSAIFTWAGLVTTRALGFALVYVFLWEGLLTSFLPGVRYLSVRWYTLAVMYGIDEQGLQALGAEAIQFPAAIVGAITVAAAFFWLTVRRLREMDVP